MSTKGGSVSHRSKGPPVSTNYFKRKEELEAINRANLRMNMKILSARAKITHVRANRREEMENYAKYKAMSSRHNANMPKIDPLVGKRLYNNKKDEQAFPPMVGPVSKKSLASMGSNTPSPGNILYGNVPVYQGRSLIKSGSVP